MESHQAWYAVLSLTIRTLSMDIDGTTHNFWCIPSYLRIAFGQLNTQYAQGVEHAYRFHCSPEFKGSDCTTCQKGGKIEVVTGRDDSNI